MRSAILPSVAIISTLSLIAGCASPAASDDDALTTENAVTADIDGMKRNADGTCKVGWRGINAVLSRS